jgi:hypothetical protein
LILRPNEEWLEAPPGQFQFWVAREEREAHAQPATLSVAELHRVAGRLLQLIEAGNRNGVALDFTSEDVSVLPDATVVLHRPGLTPLRVAGETDGWRFLSSLPLDPQARALLVAASDLESLARSGWKSAGDATTVVTDSSPEDATLVASAPARSSKVFCIHCGASLLPDDAFCGDCGKATDSGSFPCPTCRTTCLAADTFCPGCGRSLP